MELKPCPFCNCELVGLNIESVGYSAICSNCDAEGPFCQTEAGAAHKWNNRPFDPKTLTSRITIDKKAIEASLKDEGDFVELTENVIKAAKLIGTED